MAQSSRQREDIGIVSGSDIIALRKVEVASTDYARQEYGATEGDMRAFARATDKRYRQLRRARKLVTVDHLELQKMIEKTAHNRS